MKKLVPALMVCLMLFSACNKEKTTADGDSQVMTISVDGLENIQKENKGKVLIFNVFASWCPPCKVETPGFVDMYNSRGNSKFELIGLSIDQSKDDLMEFIKDYNITYPVYHITPSVQRKLMADRVPTTLIFRPDGTYYKSILGAIDGEELYRIVMSLS